MWTTYEQLLNTVGDKITSLLLLSQIDTFIANKTKLKHVESKRTIFATCWLIISVACMVTTWYLYAYYHGGVQKVLEKYDTRLPRISYTGADRPAYFLFCTLIPIGCLMIRPPIIRIMGDLQKKLIELGLPSTSYCHCFWCCCCCCVDSRLYPSSSTTDLEANNTPTPAVIVSQQATNVSSSSSSSSWVPDQQTKCQCWSPYLVYMVMALKPLAETSIHGLAVLASVSISFTSIGRGIHLLGAMSFFYGMIALELCWVLCLKQIHSIWPHQFTHVFGFDLESGRYKAHVYLCGCKIGVLVTFDYLMWVITYMIGVQTGNWGPLKFQYRYVTALSQWTMVSLIVLSVFAYAHDIDAFLDQSSSRVSSNITSSSSSLSPSPLPPLSSGATASSSLPPSISAKPTTTTSSSSSSSNHESESKLIEVEMKSPNKKSTKVEPDSHHHIGGNEKENETWAQSVFE